MTNTMSAYIGLDIEVWCLEEGFELKILADDCNICK